MSNELAENKMGVMPVNRLLVTMSLPIMISMLIQALYNIVDSIFVAQISENALTAVSLAFPIQNLMIAVATGTGVGINAMLSKSLGEKDKEKVDLAASNGLFLALLSSIVFIIAGIFGSRLFFLSQTQNAEIVELGTSYLTICCVFSFGVFFQITFERLLQATGRTLLTMITQSTGAIINIILDPIMIFGLLGFPKMGIAGAAAATVIGQIIAAILSVFINHHKNHEVTIRLRGFRPHGATIKRIYAIGVPSIIMASISSVMTYGMNLILIRFTETATTVFGVYFKLQSFIFMPVFGLNNGLVPIVSYNYGARRPKRINATIKYSIIYATALMAIGMAVFMLIPETLLSMFNASEKLIEIGVPALRIISLSFLLAGFAIICSSVFQAMGNGMLSLYVSVGRQLVVLLPVAFLLAQTGVLDAVWWAFPIAELVSLILSALFLIHVKRTKINPLSEEHA